MRHRQIWFRELNEKISDLCWTPASQEAEQLDQSDQAPQPSEEIRVCNERKWNGIPRYFSVQFVPLSQFIGAILASSGMCQVQFDLYRCWGRRLIWNNEEVSPILPYYNTIVTVVVYFCSQGYTGLLRFGDRCGHLAHLNIRSEEEQVSDPQSWCGCLLQVQQDWRASWEPATAPRPGPHFMSRVRYWNWLSIHKCRHLVNRLICTLPFQSRNV